jgi:hypothetical protein
MVIATIGRSWRQGGSALAVVLGVLIGFTLPSWAAPDLLRDVQPAASIRKQQAAAQARLAATDREIAEAQSALAELATQLTTATAEGDTAAAALNAALDAEVAEPPAEPDVQEPKGKRADPLPPLRAAVAEAQERIAELAAKQAKLESSLAQLREQRAAQQAASDRLGWHAEYIEGAAMASIAEREGALHQAQAEALAAQAEDRRKLAYERTVALAELRHRDGDANEIAATVSEVRSLEKQARDAAHQLDANKYGVVLSAKRYERGTAMAEAARAKLAEAGETPDDAAVAKALARYERVKQRQASGGGFWYRYFGRPLEVVCSPFAKLGDWLGGDAKPAAAKAAPAPSPDPAAAPSAPVPATPTVTPAAPSAPIQVEYCPVCRQIGHRADQHATQP